MKAKYVITIFQDENQEYRWHAKRNGRIVAESGEGYKRKGTLKKTLEHLIEAISQNDFMINE